MAKKKAKPDKKLMPAKEVSVKSRAYGIHMRAARGSKTPVEVNKVLKKNAAKTVVINAAAKRVNDLLKGCGKPFKEAMLWQGMLGRMRKAASDDLMKLLKTLEGMELNSKYPLQRFGSGLLALVKWSKKTCAVSLHSSMLTHIKSSDTQYCYELFLLLLGKDEKHDGLLSGRTEWKDKGEADGESTFSFSMPRKMEYYVLCLHLMTGTDGKETGTLASRGMRIVEVGDVGD